MAMSGKVITFFKQNQALEYSKSRDGLSVFSYEYDEKGRRRFLVASKHDFWKYYQNTESKHFYEVIPYYSHSKLYFDLEFLKQENKNKDGQTMTEKLIQKVNLHLKETYNLDSTISDVMVLDSSNSIKFSCHLIFQKVFFSENKKITNFLSDFESKLSDIDKSVFQVIHKGEVTSFVDKLVYSYNRNFRLIGSTKYGKSTPLTRASFDVSTFGDSSYKNFKDSLITSIEDDCRLLDNIEGSRKSEKIQGARNNNTAERNNSTNLPSPFSELDDFVKSQLPPGGYIRSWNISYNDSILYSVGGSRFCLNVNREHRSNHIYFVCDLAKMTMAQLCHSNSCAGFRSEETLIPAAVFQWWHDEFR